MAIPGTHKWLLIVVFSAGERTEKTTGRYIEGTGKSHASAFVKTESKGSFCCLKSFCVMF